MKSFWKAAVIASGLCWLLVGVASAQSENFASSLHATRDGKNTWYGAENGGFENFTNVPVEQLGCVECHGPTDANGDPYAEPFVAGCNDCHPDSFFPVDQNQCLSCHGRQKTEAQALGYSDVHRDSGMMCWDCHSTQDLHGDGNSYVSMLEPGAVDADCENCHTTPSPEHASYDPHAGKLHCTSCHAQTVISCYNCHFESQVESHVKRAKQPLHNFVILANRDKDNKVYPMTFQSLTYEGNAFAAFGPFTSHTITREGRTCTDCHANMGGTIDAIDEYNATGVINFAEWDDVTKVLTSKTGIVPMPADYETSFKMDFITYDGDTSDPPGPSTNWSSIGKDTWDGHQMFYATPLTEAQMASLGMEAPPVSAVVSSFEVQVVGGSVHILCNVQDVTDGAFRVTATYGAESWDVEVSSSSEGIVARDDVSHLTGGGEVTYTLLYQESGSGWMELTHENVLLAEIPKTVVLHEAYPNPFNPMTKVAFTLTGNQHVRVAIYDMKGALVSILTDQEYGGGQHTLTWNGRDQSGSDVSAGTYLVQMRSDTNTSSNKISLVR